MKKILHLLNTATFSGAENVVCEIINMFKGSEYEMAYCSMEGSIRDTLLEKHIDFYPILKMSSRELKRVIEDYHPDIIHAHDMRAAFLASKVSNKTQVICHIHNNAFDARKLSPRSIAFLLASVKIRHIFWVSEESKKDYYFSKLVNGKSSVLHNILDVEKLLERVYQDPNRYKYDIVYLGRLSDEKDPLRILEICKMIKITVPSIKLAIIGDGPLRDEMEHYVDANDLRENVEFLGFKSNPLRVLQDSTIMIMTSKREGLPMCVLESQAVGTPTVCTSVGELVNIITNNENGYLCNTNEEFVNQIKLILNDKSLCDKLSLKAVAFSKKYNDKHTYMDNIRNVYSGALR